jgi:hypothetical protein
MQPAVPWADGASSPSQESRGAIFCGRLLREKEKNIFFFFSKVFNFSTTEG